MKTLYGYLIDETTKKVRHKDLDKLAMKISKKADDENELLTESFKALFRFSACTLHYMTEELNSNEITWGSFFKLLMCEVNEDGKKPEDKVTVYDILLQEAGEKSAVIYQLHEFYTFFDQYMPSCDIIFNSIELACEELEIEFVREELQQEMKAWKEAPEKKEEEPDQSESEEREQNSGYKEPINIQINEMMLVKDIMRHLNMFQQTFVDSNIDVAWKLIDKIEDEELKDIFWYFLSEYEDFGPVMEAVREYGMNM